MAKDRTHTHTGHCQACGRIQAVDVSKKTIAKHGYRVAGFGFFAGTCRGSDYPALELSKVYCEEIQIQCYVAAKREDATIVRLQKGEEVPVRVNCMEMKYGQAQAVRIPNPLFKSIWDKPRQDREVIKTAPFYEADELSQKTGVAYAISGHQSEAKMLRDHAKELKALAIRIHGKDLIPVPSRIEAKIGTTFMDGGVTWEIMEERYSQRGYRATTRWMCKRSTDGKIFGWAKATVTKILNKGV